MPLWIFLPLSIMCAMIVLYRYLTINRVAAGIGWTLIILAIGGFGSGLAESFAWAGFLFIFTGSAGLLIVLLDTIFRRHARRRGHYAERHPQTER